MREREAPGALRPGFFTSAFRALDGENRATLPALVSSARRRPPPASTNTIHDASRCFGERRAGEDQLIAAVVDDDAGVIAHFAGDDLAAERRLEFLLQQALPRPRAVDRIVADACEVFERRVGQLDFDLAFGESRPQPRQLDRHDLFELLARQAV